MAENTNKINEKIILINRENLSLTGVKKVISAKSDLIQIALNNGGLIVSGKTLQVDKLDTGLGTLDIIGNVDAIKYTTSKNEGFWKRIFK